MKNKYNNNSIRTFFFVAISFLFLTVFENGINGTDNYSYASERTNIEAIFQPEIPKVFQPYDGSSSFKQRKEYGSFYLENVCKCWNKKLLSANNFSTIHLNNQSNDTLNIHHIISILQKNNTWHQSSDDDPSPHDYC